VSNEPDAYEGDGAREIFVMDLGFKGAVDFRPHVVDANEPEPVEAATDPKASSALESAESSSSETTPETESNASSEQPAIVEKAITSDSVAIGQPTF